MEDQHYYTDPLAAAWMMKHFGMRIHTGGGDLYNLTADYARNTLTERVLSVGGKLYIHPASLPLLEPQKDDIVDLGDHGLAFVVERNGNNIDCALFDISSGVFQSGHWHRRWHPIVKRNGLAFMWPESEVS